jgi:hypothetical protein
MMGDEPTTGSETGCHGPGKQGRGPREDRQRHFDLQTLPSLLPHGNPMTGYLARLAADFVTQVALRPPSRFFAINEADGDVGPSTIAKV